MLIATLPYRFAASILLFGTLFGGTAVAEPFTAEHLVSLDRVGAPNVSPDGRQVAFTLRTTDMDEGKGRYDIWMSRLDGSGMRQLTTHEANDTDPAWSPNGGHLYFLSSRDGTSQVWRIAMDGGEAVQVTRLPVDIGTYRLTEPGDHLIVSLDAYLDCDELECTAARNEARNSLSTTGVLYEQLFMRHWDHWLTEKRSRLFSVALTNGIANSSEPILVSGGVDADVPSRVWGGNKEYAISADGKTLYFAARIRDRNEPTSTNFDVYSAPMKGDGPTVNLTAGNAAWDTQPVLSPDGKTLAYLAMERPGFEADRFAIMIRDLESGTTRELAPDWDRSASSINFSKDSASLYVNAHDIGNQTLWRIGLADGKPEKLVGSGNVSAIDAASGHVVYASSNLKSPAELFVLEGADAQPRQLTNFSGPQLKNVEMGDYEQFSFAGADNETVYGYVVKPAGFKKGKKYPVAFLLSLIHI